MLPTELLLKERVQLYNNVGQLSGCPGRLSAELQVSPSPQIYWDFQVIGTSSPLPEQHLGKDADLSASWFRLDRPRVSGFGNSVNSRQVRGPALQAWYGDSDALFHEFTFYLPNARCCEESFDGQKLIEAKIEERSIGSLETTWLGGRGEARSIESKINEEWSVRLVTKENALDWLSLRQANVGTLLTTEGILYPACIAETQRPDISKWPTMTLTDAKQVLDILSMLLSFANGGYLAPLYIQGRRYSEDPTVAELPAATAISRLVTPLEDLGSTWVDGVSNLPGYLRCLPALQKMLSGPPWDQAFYAILEWYFQAIQPTPGLGNGKLNWPITASAAGAALERLAHTILVQEEQDAGRKADMEQLFGLKKVNPNRPNSEERLCILLDRAGLHPNERYHVRDFVYLRNEAVHPGPGTVPDHRRPFLIRAAIQWIEELILWRLGYDGKYHHRIASDYRSTEPRYDLAKRDPAW